MRIFFLFLLMLNILFAAWQYYSPKKIVSEIAPLSDRLDRLVLLKEADPVVKESPEVIEAVNEDVVEQSVKSKICYTLGPYIDKDVVTQIESQLAGNVIDFVVREREEQELHRYWIYLPGDNNRQSARGVSKSLAKKNIKDYYIIQKGEKMNSISLGHFKEKANADARVSKVRKLGFKPEIEAIYRDYKLYWLDYSIEADNAEIGVKMQEYLIDGVTLLDRKCFAD